MAHRRATPTAPTVGRPARSTREVLVPVARRDITGVEAPSTLVAAPGATLLVAMLRAIAAPTAGGGARCADHADAAAGLAPPGE